MKGQSLRIRKIILFIGVTLILLLLNNGNEAFAIKDSYTTTSLDIFADSFAKITSGAAIIPKGDFTIDEDDKRFQLSEDYSGTVTISKDVSKVTIASYASIIHNNTCITMEGEREQAIELTIEDVNIKASFENNGIDFTNAGEFDNKLYISGFNKVEVTSNNADAAICVPKGVQLTINKADGLNDDEAQLDAIGKYSGTGITGGDGGDGGTITIDGGTITAISGYGTGIGGNKAIITISGGTVTASGEVGIGGDGGTITIDGGTVTATNGSSGAGIGIGGNGGIITINGGKVTASGVVGVGGNEAIITISGGEVTATGDTGIGSRGWGTSAKTINISGGIVVAEGSNGAGIGRGNADSKDTDCNIIISGKANVTASSRLGAGIGGGGSGRGGVNITISGGTISATGGEYGAGIGGGSNGLGGIITISDGTVTAIGDYYGAGIGGGYKGDAGTINIIGGTIIASGGNRGAGIGTGQEGIGVTINISGGFINAQGSTNFGAAIGGGDNSLSGIIRIDEGTIIAIGKSGPGIGFSGNGSTININGGIVNAEGGAGRAGISCVETFSGPIDRLTINDGIIEAKGGIRAAGIGGGFYQSVGNITINGGTITATGGDEGAGIGGGYYASLGNITINGGSVTATGGDKGAGIGGGFYGSGCDVIITGTPIIIATGDIEEYAQNIGYGCAEIDSGTLKDEFGNDLVYININTSGLSEVNLKVEINKDDNWITVTNESCKTNEQGFYGIFTYKDYDFGRYILSKPKYETNIGLYYVFPTSKNINISSEMFLDNTPPTVEEIFIENNEICILLDSFEVLGTIYLIPKTDTIYSNKEEFDDLDGVKKVDLFWAYDAYFQLSELREGYYQVYVVDGAENVSIPYEIHYYIPRPSKPKSNSSIIIGSETFSIQSQFNRVTGNVETDISKSIFEKLSDDNMTVSIPQIKGANSYTLSFTKEGLFSAKKDINITMDTQIGTIVFPKEMIVDIQGDEADKVQLTIRAAKISDLSLDLQNELKNKPIIQLLLTVDGKQIAWNNPNTPVSISIPYTPTAEELNNLEHIVVWYIDGNGNVVSVPNGRYDKETGKVTFTTTHFSKYAIAYEIKTFDDINNIEWAKKSIEVLASKGAIKGVSVKEYAPQENITRVDFLYYLIRTLNVDIKTDENFDDILSDAYYYKEIAVAKKLGITNGTGNNKFTPDSYITRQDIMVLTEKALRMVGKLTNEATSYELEKYSDRLLISDYAVNSISSLVKDELIIGTDNKINPTGLTTRAEAAVFLYRIFSFNDR
jgi:hypothetical protein